MDLLSRDGIIWIITSVLERAKETVEESDGSDFYKGVMQGYYEVLDMIKSRIIIRDGNPKDFGLDFDLEGLETEMKKRIKKDVKA